VRGAVACRGRDDRFVNHGEPGWSCDAPYTGGLLVEKRCKKRGET
jgi:hypothetical protein